MQGESWDKARSNANKFVAVVQKHLLSDFAISSLLDPQRTGHQRLDFLESKTPESLRSNVHTAAQNAAAGLLNNAEKSQRIDRALEELCAARSFSPYYISMLERRLTAVASLNHFITQEREVSARAKKRRDRADPQPHVAITELCLSTLSSLIEDFELEDAASIKAPLDLLAAMLADVEVGELFSDWSPPRLPPEVPVAVNLDECKQSRKAKKRHEVACAFDGDDETCWQNVMGTQNLTIALQSEMAVSALEVTWAKDKSNVFAPKSVDVEV